MVTPTATLADTNWVSGTSHFLLQRARNIYSRFTVVEPETLGQHCHIRFYVVSAVASAALEAFVHVFIAAMFAGVLGIKTLICLVLQGVFVGMWALIGWLSGQALVKSPLQWLSFVVLQVTLGFANPSHWVSQWKLWGRILHSMGSFANGAAALADWLSDGVNSFASWTHIFLHLQHTSHLGLFVLGSLRASLVNPQKVIASYGVMIRAWPLDAVALRAIELAEKKAHRPALIAVAVMSSLLATHFLLPGYEARRDIAGQLAHYTWSGSGLLMRAVMKLTATGVDYSVGMVWRWYYAGPDEQTRNEAAQAIKEMKNVFEGLTKQVSELITLQKRLLTTSSALVPQQAGAICPFNLPLGL